MPHNPNTSHKAEKHERSVCLCRNTSTLQLPLVLSRSIPTPYAAPNFNTPTAKQLVSPSGFAVVRVAAVRMPEEDGVCLYIPTRINLSAAHQLNGG
jgi:hypothetical protein